MGLATAKIVGRDKYVVIVGRSQEKINNALQELEDLSITAFPFVCDISNIDSVKLLARFAKNIGEIDAVIHAAGMSPHMGNARKIIEANALGTVNINKIFGDVIENGGCKLNVSSMSAYLFPNILAPYRSYKKVYISPESLVDIMVRFSNIFPKKLKSQIAYSLSKHFVVWFAKREAKRLGERSVRVISISPGFFETPMGALEAEEAKEYVKYCAIRRLGRSEERRVGKEC